MIRNKNKRGYKKKYAGQSTRFDRSLELIQDLVKSGIIFSFKAKRSKNTINIKYKPVPVAVSITFSVKENER